MPPLFEVAAPFGPFVIGDQAVAYTAVTGTGLRLPGTWVLYAMPPAPLSRYLRPLTDEARELLAALEAVDEALIVA